MKIDNIVKQVLKKLRQKGYAVTGHTFNRNSKLIKIFCSREAKFLHKILSDKKE